MKTNKIINELKSNNKKDEIEYDKLKQKNTVKGPMILLKKILAFYKGFTTPIIISVVLMIIATILSLSTNLVLKQIIDKLVKRSNDTISRIIILYAILLLLSLIIKFIGSTLKATTTQKIIYNLRNKLFKHIQSLDISFFDKHQSGDIISTFVNDIELLSNALDQAIPLILISSLEMFFALILLFILQPILAIVSLILTIIHIFVVSKLVKKSRMYSTLYTKKLGDLTAYTEEMSSSISTVKSFNYEAKNIKEFKKISERLKYLDARSAFFSGSIGEITAAFSTLSSAVIAMIGGMLLLNGYVSLGGLITFIQVSNAFIWPIQSLAQYIPNLLLALAGTDRILNILHVPSEIDDGKIYLTKRNNLLYWNDKEKLIEAKGHIEFKNVSFSYSKDNNKVLKNISLYAKPNQKIAFVGATGAGKTTVTNLVNRFYEIDEGQILIDGIDLRNIKKKELRQSLTTVLQDTNLFSGSIKDNIRFGNPDATDEDILNAAKLSNADVFISKLPHKYDTIINPDDCSLSKGEMQLISITRAAISKPLVLMLDEATSSIDTKTEKLVQDGLDKLMASATTLVIAHRLSTVKNANAILVIDNGEIIERGDHDDLLNQKGKYYNLYTGKEILV